jgi:hypothetical protein
VLQTAAWRCSGQKLLNKSLSRFVAHRKLLLYLGGFHLGSCGHLQSGEESSSVPADVSVDTPAGFDADAPGEAAAPTDAQAKGADDILRLLRVR